MVVATAEAAVVTEVADDCLKMGSVSGIEKTLPSSSMPMRSESESLSNLAACSRILAESCGREGLAHRLAHDTPCCKHTRGSRWRVLR